MKVRGEGLVPKPATGTETRLAPLYRVLIHNDDKTPMDFVVYVLRTVFTQLTEEDAIAVMLEAHHTGVALVCVETLEQAEFHVDQAHSLARGAKYPLTLTYEPEEGGSPGS
jgi:ATP-dependent Clp protease adaptor protein ClpS